MQFISQLLEHPSLLAYFSGANNYSWLQFHNGERRLLAKPLTYFEERLPTFIRVHKTVLINPHYVVGLQSPPRPKMAGIIGMQDGTTWPVSRRRWNQVVAFLAANPPTTHLPNTPSDSLPREKVNPHSPNGPLPIVVLAVMTADNLLLARQCIKSLGLACVLEHAEVGNELATALSLSPMQEWPALIILDARANRADRILTLRALKSHPQLCVIPVVWLATPDDDIMQVYALEANSAVVVSNEPASFVQAVDQLCRYWLMFVRLPPEINAS